MPARLFDRPGRTREGQGVYRQGVPGRDRHRGGFRGGGGPIEGVPRDLPLSGPRRAGTGRRSRGLRPRGHRAAPGGGRPAGERAGRARADQRDQRQRRPHRRRRQGARRQCHGGQQRRHHAGGDRRDRFLRPVRTRGGACQTSLRGTGGAHRTAGSLRGSTQGPLVREHLLPRVRRRRRGDASCHLRSRHHRCAAGGGGAAVAVEFSRGDPQRDPQPDVLQGLGRPVPGLQPRL